MKADCAIIGGGIIGLSVAMHLGRRQPGLRLVVLEKEPELTAHQTGRNSGVIHSGIYYKPGSLKARYAVEGNRSMRAFCERHGISHEVCGKVIVATQEDELGELDQLLKRGRANNLKVETLAREEVRDVEPHVRCLKGLKVPSTAIVSYREVGATLAKMIELQGGVIRLSSEVTAISESEGGHWLETTTGPVEAAFLINCGGLHSDRLARKAGCSLEAQITPFRGEYYQLTQERRHLVTSLIYPVPNPAFPFLGVHFTRMIDGSVHAGPNAVLALEREGYLRRNVKLCDLAETVTYPGFWKLARKHYKEGLAEVYRSFSKAAFVRSLQKMIPDITADDLVPAKAGVRAQALLPTGALADDFLLVSGRRSIHICNAPSPAATASLEIGKEVVGRIPRLSATTTVSLAAT
jgi:(S)-2-hydroxyglutarate dehydrogenase